MDRFEETDFFETSGSLEFIVLSEADCYSEYSFSSDWRPSPLDYCTNWNAGQWKFYHVLLLEWNGGIAERRGIGIIYQKAVERTYEPGPLWKEIFLA